MKNLTELSEGQKAKIVAINGDKRYLTRVTSIGLSIGCEVEMLQNLQWVVPTGLQA